MTSADLQPRSAEAAPDLRDELRFLASAAAQPGQAEPVQLVETHVSWLVLSAQRVWKLKKPVRGAWFDFSTVDAREANAREEVRLNRRLAPDVYAGVLALQRNNGLYALVPDSKGAAGPRTVDWLVEMRRLPAERMLDRMIPAREVQPCQVDALVAVLARFYRQAPRSPLLAGEYLARFASEQRANRDTLLQPRFHLDRAAAVLDAFDLALQAKSAALRERVRQGRLVDGHGDLRPEHVCLSSPPLVIDALEFSPVLRQVDPMDELAFLGLECEVAGAPWIALRLRSRAPGLLDDPMPATLWRFYRASRALLRARLCAAHLLDAQPRLASTWLPRARDYLRIACRALDGRVSGASPRDFA